MSDASKDPPLNDLQREQASEREILRRILDKLPDAHSIRAIELD